MTIPSLPTAGANWSEWATALDTEARTGRLSDTELRAAFGTVDVIAPKPTGVAATDTANLTTAIAATPVGGHLHIPGDGAAGTPYVIDQEIVVDKSLTISGRSVSETFTVNFDSPSSPYVRGTVIKQITAATNILRFTSNVSPQVFRLGLSFDPAISGNTGHGVYSSATPSDSGLLGFLFEDVIVAGHDGNHYAFYLMNPMHGTMVRPRGYGGGGLFVGCNSTSGNYGNMVITHPTFMVENVGTAVGYGHSARTSSGAVTGALGLLTYIRPQCNMFAAGSQATWDDTLGTGVPNGVVAINPDLENAPGGAQVLRQGSHTEFIGGDQINRGDTNNTRYGIAAMSNPEGGNNTAYGRSALASLTTGNSNVAVGFEALTAGTNNATSNVAIGSGALAASNNSFNTAVGFQALTATTGWKNTAVGNQAGPSTPGSDHTTSLGAGASANALGAVAIGIDSAGTGATTNTQDEFIVGTALHRVKVAGRLNVATRTPTGSADAQGAVGDIATDDSYVYVKTSTGWKRAALTTW